jgi:hypothetical protein
MAAVAIPGHIVGRLKAAGVDDEPPPGESLAAHLGIDPWP